MKLVQHIMVQSIDADQRLDRFLKRKFPVLKQSQIEKICRKGEVRIDGGRCKPATRLVQFYAIGQALFFHSRLEL